ncbi:lebercilin isoform X3 [Narcine bancroftii]|uniref:lebercilin isoform X3 n=1 Tax=Narcine bancroftii TaxID=1343680 RepID=UPI003831BC0C
MDSQNGYNDEENTVDSEAERSLWSGASTQRKFVTNDNKEENKPTKQSGKSENALGDQEKTKKSVDDDRNTNSYYSDDYDNLSYLSEPYCSENSGSRTPSPRRKGHVKQKANNSICDQDDERGKNGEEKMLSRQEAAGKSGAKQPSRHGSRRFWNQRLNKEPIYKDIDLVTKRMLSARLVKINELRNEVTELQVKLEELQKENKILKHLQYRQEKALSKFEDTENEISLLISRHNNEIRILRERLRKSQEKERIMEKRLKDTEEELHRTKNSLLKLKKLSEDKHLIERDELAQKLAKAEIKMEGSERRIKDLERNLELTNNSFLRQVTTERKKTQEAKEDVHNLQEEIQRLGQKLKEKEKELDVRNIYANRILKSSPKKDSGSTPKRKGTSSNAVKCVQSEQYFLPSELPTPPLAIGEGEEMSIKGDYSQVIKEHHVSETLEWNECLRRGKEQTEHEEVCEEKLKREHEQHKLELKAEKLREKWEQERQSEEKDRRVKGTRVREDEIENSEKMDERRKKEILLAKMREIDEETNGSSLFSPRENTSYSSSVGSDSPERWQKSRIFPESDKIPVESYGHRSNKSTDRDDELSFGMYTPSFGKGSGRSGLVTQRFSDKEEQSNGYFEMPVKDKKSSLMDQLFGSGSGIGFTSKGDDLLINMTQNSDWNSSPFPWEKTNSQIKTNETGETVFSDGIISSSRHRSKYTSVKPVIKVIDSPEDEIEQVVL